MGKERTVCFLYGNDWHLIVLALAETLAVQSGPLYHSMLIPTVNCCMSKLSALHIVNTSLGISSHTDLFHCSSAIAVTNLSCVSVDDTIPN